MNDRGQTVQSAAKMMGLSLARVRELVEDEQERRELASFKCDSIPIHLTRAAIEEALRLDSELTIADIARWLEMRQIDFERAFLGKNKNGRPKRRVHVSSASRLMIGLGRAPNDLPGC